MSQRVEPDPEQFLAQLNDTVDAYVKRTQGRRGTKTWLAQKLICDRTTLYKYLDGTNRIPLATLRALISLLGLGADEENTLLFLGGYGVAVPVVTTPPPRDALAAAPNPFWLRGRIDDPAAFFGREELLRRIFEELGRGSNLSLIGEREVGKSSLLYMIQHQGVARLGLPPEALVHIDMQLIRSEEAFFEVLCGKLGLDQIYRGYQIISRLPRRRYILCLDEIEKMRRERFTADVRDELRGLADGAKAPLTLVIASSLPLFELFPDKLGETSPLNICSPMDVPPFSRAEARAFLVARLHGTGIAFSDDEIADLLVQSRCHPGRLQQDAATLYQQKTRG